MLSFNATDDSRRVLEQLLQFESQIQDGGGFFEGVSDLNAKAHCAGALVMLDEDAGHDYLIAGYREYLGIKLSPQPHSECRNLMEGMYDAKLIERIEALRDDEAITETTAQNNINTLLSVMRINGL